MNIHVLNRVLAILFSVLAVIFWTGLVFTVWVYPRPLGSSVRQMGTALVSADPVFQVMVSLLGLAVVLVAFLILLTEFMPETGTMVQLPQVSGGHAMVSIDSLSQVVKHEAEQVPQVIYARPQVTSLGSTVDVTVELRTQPVAHVPSAIEEVCRVVRAALEDRTGVPIRNLTVRLRNEPDTLTGRAAGLLRGPDAAAAPTITVPASVAPPATVGLSSHGAGDGHQDEPPRR